MIVLDTNILSEPIKPHPSKNVLGWLAQWTPSSLYTTAVSQAEILAGVELLPSGKRKTSLSDAVSRMFLESFPERILPFDPAAAQAYSKIVAHSKRAGRPISMADAMIAAIVQTHQATLVTRNVEDFSQCGIRLINPWKA
ncbi:MAG: type II toxin-antitoxin system VapC family toxin [Acidobacteriota bacterium]